uniref:Uncharacterized protein n=1 Tax=Avena sativa TaxID=4498 RepID=A0ACD6AAZ5_AVESA
MELKNATTSLVRGFASTEAQLVRVEVLVLFSTLAWVLLELLGQYRRQNSHGFFRILVWAVHTLSTVLAPYTIGLLQAGPFGDQTFVLWGVQVSSDSLSVYSIQDIGQRKRLLVQQVSQIFLVLWLILNGSGGNKSYSATCWVFLICSIILTRRKFRALGRVSKKGGLVECAKVIADYMVVEHHLPQDVDDPIPKPSTMKGYRYIFDGEMELAGSLPTSPEYRVEVTNAKIITIDTVWGWINIQDFKYKQTAEVYKETTLSYTLFKLLKRRFCDYPLSEAGLQKTLDFVLDGLLSERGNYVCAFRVIEGELSFLYDFFYTRMESSNQYWVLVTPFISTAIVWNSISGAFSKHYHRSNLEQRVKETDVIHWVTIVLLACLVFVHLVAICISPDRFTIVGTVHHRFSETIRGAAREPETLGSWKKNTKHSPLGRGTWEQKLGQYSLLLNFNYDPWNVLSFLSLGLVDATRKGQKAGEKIKLEEEVIVRVLSRFKENGGKLENGQSALARNKLGSQLSWACTLPTHIQTILVWHIGTTISRNEVSLEAPLNVDRLLAESLSEYCAYLVAFVPDMLPGHGYDTQRIFDAVVMEARRHLSQCETMSDRCEKLKMGLHRRYDSTVLGMGAKLGGQLIEMDEAQRWKVLADFWEEFVLFLAPSKNADIHAEMLAAGGEFMTHLWALLTHAGILERPSSSSRVEPLGESDGTAAQDSGILEHPSSPSGVEPAAIDSVV